MAEQSTRSHDNCNHGANTKVETLQENALFIIEMSIQVMIALGQAQK